jgi:hypothetical protein
VLTMQQLEMLLSRPECRCSDTHFLVSMNSLVASRVRLWDFMGKLDFDYLANAVGGRYFYNGNS